MSWKASLPYLLGPHVHYSPGAYWCLTRTGVAIGGAAVTGTLGDPATVRRVWSWFGDEIVASARVHDVPAELIVATICTESAGGGATELECLRARRIEPGWVSDELTPGRVSIGCMQTLVSTAIAVTPHIKPHLTALMLQTASVSIDAGTAVIAAAMLLHRYDPPLVAASYNAGGIYFDPSPTNRWRMRCYPLGSGAYIDRFILWFNDAMALPEGPVNADGAPAFSHMIHS